MLYGGDDFFFKTKRGVFFFKVDKNDLRIPVRASFIAIDCKSFFISAGDMFPCLLIRYATVPVTYAVPFKKKKKGCQKGNHNGKKKLVL